LQNGNIPGIKTKSTNKCHGLVVEKITFKLKPIAQPNYCFALQKPEKALI